jgi:carbonic anhydrase
MRLQAKTIQPLRTSMCKACDDHAKSVTSSETSPRASRRNVLFGAAAGVTALAAISLTTGRSGQAFAAGDAAKTALTPDQALAALKEGNARYVSSPQSCSMDLSKQRESTAASQAPWAIIVSCADSRVPPELLFGGLGIGQLFVARNAGNVVDTVTLGTIEYGAGVLGAPLIVVLGHEKCGAAAAACEVVTKKTVFPGSIGQMIEPIIPAALSVQGQPGDFVDNTIIESAKRTVRRLSGTGPIIGDLVKAGKLKIVSARYDLKTGQVDFHGGV